MGMRWDPFRDAMSLREAVDRLLEQSVISPRGSASPGRGVVPLPLDLWETAETLEIRAPIPGLKPDAEDLEISIDGKVLTIVARLPGVATEDAESPEVRTQNMRWYYREIPRGETRRSIELPVAVDADAARARIQDGVLLLTLPKAQAARPRRINVTPG